ncbi:MAG: lipocalin-like domain-containing protein [Verrucomicrobiaceae bacterium]
MKSILKFMRQARSLVARLYEPRGLGVCCSNGHTLTKTTIIMTAEETQQVRPHRGQLQLEGIRALVAWTVIRSLFIGVHLWFSLSAQAQTTSDGFAIPQPGRVFNFPRDHGSHPEFRTEWWYITGHLDSTTGQRFGFQVTFFRQVSKDKQQLYLAHCALLDVRTGKFIHEERLNREGWDAASSTTTLDVRNGNWSLKGKDAMQLAATINAEALLQLTLQPLKSLVFFGKDGVSRKGLAPEAASHYLTFPRLHCTGKLNLGNATHEVTGSAWMDHEFSSSQLDEGQVGWDWASLQLNDGHEVMVYRMRRADGSSDPNGSTLAWVGKDGYATHTSAFTWQPLRTWTSPKSKAVYPIATRIETHDAVFELRPLADNQELSNPITGLAYWEGACDVLDAKGQVIGSAFLELAGYGGDLARHLRGK